MPWMEPSFFPFGSKSSMPTHLPGAKDVVPQKRTIPLPVEISTRAPTGGSTPDMGPSQCAVVVVAVLCNTVTLIRVSRSAASLRATAGNASDPASSSSSTAYTKRCKMDIIHRVSSFNSRSFADDIPTLCTSRRGRALVLWLQRTDRLRPGIR